MVRSLRLPWQMLKPRLIEAVLIQADQKWSKAFFIPMMPSDAIGDAAVPGHTCGISRNIAADGQLMQREAIFMVVTMLSPSPNEDSYGGIPIHPSPIDATESSPWSER